jgi:hypothetical protein
MGLTTGLVLLGLGALMDVLGILRGGEELRPFLRSPLTQVLYPSACLVLLSMGATMTITNNPTIEQNAAPDLAASCR